MKPADISINDFTYDLPDDRIAARPLPERDASKLLIYRNGEIMQDVFSGVADHLPSEALLIYNDTRVINARLRFSLPSGSQVEIFCLEPTGIITSYNEALLQTSSTRWKCLVGGLAKWKAGVLEQKIYINKEKVALRAELIEKLPDGAVISFSWLPKHLSFAALLQSAGNTPLPPYIKRLADDEDEERYQTIFAKEAGSVAAPTAALHFTEEVLQSLEAKNIQRLPVTLHVGAGTFKPVKAATMAGHDMHAEYIDVKREAILALARHPKEIIALGTTSLRTLETLYWLGVKTILQPDASTPVLSQWEIYEQPLMETTFSKQEALEALSSWMLNNKLANLFTSTQLLIVPGYRFRVADLLITNFHQPQSTLLLLVAAATGGQWREIYDYALANNFRFLSYGDSSVIYIAQG